jgi:hypothetical protein
VITAVDSSVLLDVLVADATHGMKSQAALRRAAAEGALIVCEAVLAEIIPALGPAEVPQLLADWQLKFVPSSMESAILAGDMFRTYLDRGGKRGRVAPDFLIGAHATVHAQRLLARDRGFFRDYFKQLKVLNPAD